MVGAQEREGVGDALLEDIVGELPVSQGAGNLERPDHEGEDAERPDPGGTRVIPRQALGDVIDHAHQAVET
jgi:hypothetical protein